MLHSQKMEMDRQYEDTSYETKNYQEKSQKLEMELDRANRQLNLKEDGILGLQAANENLKSKCKYLEEENLVISKSLEDCQADLNLKTDQVEEMCVNGGTLPSTYLVEIDQLKSDNCKLMDMLRQTKEYADFAGYVKDCGGNVRAAKENQAQNGEDFLDWIPDAAYKGAHEFRNKYGNELTPGLVNTLLSDLNKIWRDREKKQL